MKAYSQYTIRQNKSEEHPIVLIVSDEDPKGVTLCIKDNAQDGAMVGFNLPRQEMIEALEYLF